MKLGVKAAAALALSTALAGHAGVLEIDQSLSSATFQIEYHAPYAQSFSVGGTHLESIAVLALNMNAFGDYLLDRNITLELHSGSGVAGPVLASHTLDAAELIGTASEAWLSFDLGAFAVQPRSIYTFALQVATPRFGTALQQDDPYTGGRAFFVDANSGIEFGSEYDLTFRVTTVAEPHAAGLLWAGFGLLAVLVRLQAARPGPQQPRRLQRDVDLFLTPHVAPHHPLLDARDDLTSPMGDPPALPGRQYKFDDS